MRLGRYTFDEKEQFYMMGILNVTPDSFSDGGKFDTLDQALFHAEQLIKDGTDILDIGGESTRPNHIKITDAEEIERVCPVIEAVRERFDICISLDTYKVQVAKAGIASGVDMINDIWGLMWDDEMADVIAKGKVGSCLMHNRKEAVYNDLMKDVIADLNQTIEKAMKAGIEKDTIMLDPGIGFAKDVHQNLTVMKHLDEICKMGYPVLLGTSKKSMIGLTLDLPVDQRSEGTIATSVMGYMAGCRFFRVHDVKENKRAIKMTKAILEA